jgi:hypothetical protein
VPESGCSIGDVEHRGLTHRLADVEGFESSEKIAVPLDQIGHPIEQLAPDRSWRCAPLTTELGTGRTHRCIDVRRGGCGNLGQGLFGGRVQVGEGASVGCTVPMPRDVELGGGAGRQRRCGRFLYCGHVFSLLLGAVCRHLSHVCSRLRPGERAGLV